MYLIGSSRKLAAVAKVSSVRLVPKSALAFRVCVQHAYDKHQRFS